MVITIVRKMYCMKSNLRGVFGGVSDSGTMPLRSESPIMRTGDEDAGVKTRVSEAPLPLGSTWTHWWTAAVSTAIYTKYMRQMQKPGKTHK